MTSVNFALKCFPKINAWSFICHPRIFLSTSCTRSINCHRASITRIKSPAYCRMYPCLLVNSDGSTIKVRYEKPRKIIRLPVDVSTLTEEERLARLDQRKPKSKVVIEEELHELDMASKYSHLWKT
ncbi:39S ribosomal protein L55, mitochondrial [Hyalella azteca]|uniref:39S ribosomal protein L55, mitochondrial n=1 Tax=Hyalella azteca TaxID=294128 RepID=A0A8B7NT26_HYAAZ|nr:39S ribosomal protein L55, mitochondrial [Hyalella azteca]